MPTFNITSYLDRSTGRLKQFRVGKLSKKRQRHKRTLFYVQEGYCKHVVNLENYYSCDCKSFEHGNLCAHTIYLLHYHLALSSEIIMILTDIKLYTIFIHLLNDTENLDELDNLVYEKICEHFKGNECGSCLNDLTDPKYELKLYQCDKCKQYCHDACFKEWCYTHKKIEKPCMYCMLAK